MVREVSKVARGYLDRRRSLAAVSDEEAGALSSEERNCIIDEQVARYYEEIERIFEEDISSRANP